LIPYLLPQNPSGSYWVIRKLFGADILNPNEDSSLQFVHGTELHTNYEFMPWKRNDSQAVFLKTERRGNKTK
jgi:hypothetical protein